MLLATQIIQSGMMRLLSLLTFALVGTMASKLYAKGFDREAPEKNRSVPFTLRWKKLRETLSL